MHVADVMTRDVEKIISIDGVRHERVHRRGKDASVERMRVRHVSGVQRRSEAEGHDQEEHTEHRHRDPVAQQPAAREHPRARAGQPGTIRAGGRFTGDRGAHRP